LNRLGAVERVTRLARATSSLARRFPHNLVRRGDYRGGDIESLQKQCEALKINSAQVLIACQQNPAIEQCSLREHQGIVALRDWQQVPPPQGVGDPLYDSVFDWNEVYGLESP